LKYLVDLIGIEPMTSSMPWKRAPSCATGPHFGKDTLYSQTCDRDSQTHVWTPVASWPEIAAAAAPPFSIWIPGKSAARKYLQEAGTNRLPSGVYRRRVSEHSAAGGAVLSLLRLCGKAQGDGLVCKGTIGVVS
jgi:hypothetical protein